MSIYKSQLAKPGINLKLSDKVQIFFYLLVYLLINFIFLNNLNLFIDILFPFLSVKSVVEIPCQIVSKAVNCHV